MSFRCAIFLLSVLLCSPALASDKFYSFPYQNLSTHQTQYMFADFNTGSAPYSFPYGMHWGFSVRGDSHNQTLPLGRGITIGPVSQPHAGFCNGVMVEDFTKNWFEPDTGLIAGTCVNVQIKPFTNYMVELHASEGNVFWRLSEQVFYWWRGEPMLDWIEVASGGCWETARTNCPRDARDGTSASAFVASVWMQSQHNWWLGSVNIGHF
jgi:hypothetical protein